MAEAGILFPKDAGGKRSTMAFNSAAFSASFASADPEAAIACAGETKWRRRYARHVVANVAVSARGPESALQVAQDGLAHLHASMRFARDGEELSLAEAMETPTGSPTLSTVQIQGSGSKATGPLSVPYKGQTLQGDALRAQIERWVKGGQIELDTGAALIAAVDNPAWSRSAISETTFVMLGASSAMGPLPLLLALGAHVIAVDINRPAVWEKIIGLAEVSPGSLTFPVRGDVAPSELLAAGGDPLFAAAGCDLLTETPEIGAWLLEVCQPEPQLVLGCYAYLDGEAFVRISLAMDALVASLAAKLPNTLERPNRLTLAYLCTPTDAHLVPAAARAAAARNRRAMPWWAGLFSLWPGLPSNARRPLQGCGSEDSKRYIVDAIVPQQGPNYILAKRLQHWRVIVSRTIIAGNLGRVF